MRYVIRARRKQTGLGHVETTESPGITEKVEWQEQESVKI